MSLLPLIRKLELNVNSGLGVKMKVNSFPSLTWNFLNINNAKTDFDFSIFPIVDGEVEIPVDFKSICTGLGCEFDSAMDSRYSGTSRPQYFDVCEKDVLEKIDFSNSGENSFSDIVIRAAAGSDSTFILSYKNHCAQSLGSRVRIEVEENARIHLVTVNMLDSDAMVFNSVGARVSDSGVFEYTELELGGAKTYTGTHVELSGYKSQFVGHASYAVRNSGLLDMNQVVDQKGQCTESHFTVDGVLMDFAQKTWRGTIDFKHGCAQSIGDEQEDVLLLSPEVTNKSLPVILCDEEAVEGRHGCSIGKLDMEKLFYMQSRGVDESTARKLLTRAKVNKVARFIEDEELVEEINSFVDRIIG